MKIYSWDEVMLEVVEHEVDDSISKLDPKIAMLAAEAITTEGEFSTRNHVFSIEDGIWVLKGQFGRDKVFVVYHCPGHPDKAKYLVQTHIDAFLERGLIYSKKN